MCGRYLFSESEQQEIKNIVSEVNEKLKNNGHPEQMVKTGEIYPTNLVPVLLNNDDSCSPEAAIWGFPHFNKKGVIINARAETAQEKRMFSKPLVTMRCVIPSTGFYEWDKSKTKYLLTEPSGTLLYMAGVINIYENERRFVILTTNANESVKEIHNRMPVILSKDELESWLSDYDFAKYILKRVPDHLHKMKAV